ncbi:hypothetical protein ACKKBF_B01450 [Auxenochlorella protothecoides x Auxenochlorella symbiontica]
MSRIATGVVIAGWYFSNIGVILLNKYLLSIFNFRYPIFLTLCHMVACSLLGGALAASRLIPVQPIASRPQMAKITLLAAIFCFTVVLGNVSLKTIPVSFNQAIGATTPAFTAALSVLMLSQREPRAVYLSLVPVVVGIVIASGAEPSFEIVGFLACVAATAGRALKSVLQSIMLDDPADRMDSMSLLLYMAPIAVVLLVPVTATAEAGALQAALVMGRQPGFWMLLILNSGMAYFVNLTNFLVTKYTSALTLQVLGNAKGVVAVVTSVLYFQNPVNAMSALGYTITVAGVVAYSQAKKRTRKVASVPKHAAQEHAVQIKIDVHAESESPTSRLQRTQGVGSRDASIPALLIHQTPKDM